jgi:hypothetical protein
MKNRVVNLFVLLRLCVGFISGYPSQSFADELAPDIKFNKLREMYAFYYLPFNIHFKVGSQVDDVFPVVPDKLGALTQAVSPEDMKKVEKEWQATREAWKQKSLFLSTPVDEGKTVRISQHLVSHRIRVNNSALELVSFSNKLTLQQDLQGKAPEAQANITQLALVKSFIDPAEMENFHFFIISPSWCASSQEYRALFEAYFKKFSNPNLTLHSIVIEDPEESIFDAKIFKELFPHKKNYSHEIVPRFIAFQQKDGKPVVYEEGEALGILYQNYFKKYQGFMNKMVSGIIPEIIAPENNPFLAASIEKASKMAQ